MLNAFDFSYKGSQENSNCCFRTNISWSEVLTCRQHKIRTQRNKFFLQLNSLDFRINRSTCKPFLVKGNVVQPPPSPGDHVMPDYNKSTLAEPGLCAASSCWSGHWAALLSCTLAPCGHQVIQEVHDWERALK